MASIPYFKLIRVPVMFSKSIGLEILKPDPKRRLQSRLLRYLLFFGITNYNIQWGFQVVFFILALRSSSMLDVTAVAPCLGFGFMGLFKQVTLNLNKQAIRSILEELEDMYPSSIYVQKNYNVEGYVGTLQPVLKIFAGLCLFNTVYFGLFPMTRSIVAVLLYDVDYDYPLGFPIWYPYNQSYNWFVYILTYGLQLHGAYMTGVAFLTADLLLVSSVTQLCMHFDYISKKLKEFRPNASEKDHQFLIGILCHHAKCLKLTESVDTVFGFSLLLNFLSSSGTICFVGFQVIAASTEDIIRFSVLMVTSLAQVLIVCIYGNKLIDSSLAVGQAAFSHEWYNSDLTYRHLIVMVIRRSQKVAAIHAPTFPPISLETFMKVISMAYQFFAVLRMMNDDK